MNDKVAFVTDSSRIVIHSIVRSLLLEGVTVILPAKKASLLWIAK